MLSKITHYAKCFQHSSIFIIQYIPPPRWKVPFRRYASKLLSFPYEDTFFFEDINTGGVILISVIDYMKFDILDFPCGYYPGHCCTVVGWHRRPLPVIQLSSYSGGRRLNLKRKNNENIKKIADFLVRKLKACLLGTPGRQTCQTNLMLKYKKIRTENHLEVFEGFCFLGFLVPPPDRSCDFLNITDILISSPDFSLLVVLFLSSLLITVLHHCIKFSVRSSVI